MTTSSDALTAVLVSVGTKRTDAMHISRSLDRLCLSNKCADDFAALFFRYAEAYHNRRILEQTHAASGPVGLPDCEHQMHLWFHRKE